jgi:hypothetical protein
MSRCLTCISNNDGSLRQGNRVRHQRNNRGRRDLLSSTRMRGWQIPKYRAPLHLTRRNKVFFSLSLPIIMPINIPVCNLNYYHHPTTLVLVSWTSNSISSRVHPIPCLSLLQKGNYLFTPLYLPYSPSISQRCLMHFLLLLCRCTLNKGFISGHIVG